MLSAEDERVPDGDTVFEIGSITKVFTGILLAESVQKGALTGGSLSQLLLIK